MKLIIQIPCFNEAETLGIVLAGLPRMVAGFDCVEWLVIDDGSSDGTASVARAGGADHVIRLPQNQGLARAFAAGIHNALRLGADVIVNTDGDNQYRSSDIPELIRPIVEKRADIVVGARPIDQIAHFSMSKRALNKFGSFVVRLVSGTSVPDAPSGFRAFSRNAARQLVLFDDYTYTLETIIQARHKNLAVTSVQIGVNREMRPSRLINSLPYYVVRSIATIVRIFAIYRPIVFFGSVGLALVGVGVAIGARFLVLLATGHGNGHTQSLVLAAIVIVVGFQALLTALLSDLLAANRKLLEEIRTETFHNRIA